MRYNSVDWIMINEQSYDDSLNICVLKATRPKQFPWKRLKKAIVFFW